MFKSLSLVAWPEKWLLDTMTIKSDFDFDIEHCPVELVWMKTDEDLIGSSMMVENVGVKFGNLDQSQGAKLDHLLSHYKFNFRDSRGFPPQPLHVDLPSYKTERYQ